ncbi:MAG: thiamine-phosphate kinase [Bacteroidales bacterium]|nr:thiamine-phosphate kinase [Bacteroidales bacterium]MBN2817721.1 thiamine-phosphate kinase [Bacteroidales bacterium]
MSSKKKEIEELGEFGLIEFITRDFVVKNSTTIKGVGDDAAVADYAGKKTVITTDILTEGIHFDLMYMPLKHLGYKSVIVNLSDVFAMNAKPQQIVVSIAISAKFTADMVEEIYSGIKLACDYYNVDMVGGDTTSSLTGLTLCITALGIADEDKICYRNGAKQNDLICVTGDLGAAYLGLQILEREKKVFNDSEGVQPDLSGFEYVLERQLKPEARHDIIDKLAEANIVPTSMIDISDGLSSELLHISHDSGCGCKVYSDRIPIAEETRTAAEEIGLEPLTIALNGGEDYELLFTVPVEIHAEIEKIEGVSIIGHVTDKSEGNYLITPNNAAIEIKAMGWDGVRK